MTEQEFSIQLQSLVSSYRPSVATHQRLAGVTLVAVVGPTGVGKTTLMQLCGLPMVMSDVTRQPRTGEVHGVDNFFRDDFHQILQEIRAGDFVQIAIGSQGDFKGTKASRYPSSGPATMAITAASLPAFYELGFGAIIPIYVVPPSYDAWLQRLQGLRDQADANLYTARMEEAIHSLEIAMADDSYQFIVNDDVNQATAALKAAVAGQYSQTDSQAARVVADSVYQALVAAN